MLANVRLDTDVYKNVREYGVLGCHCYANDKRLALASVSKREGQNYLDDLHCFRGEDSGTEVI